MKTLKNIIAALAVVAAFASCSNKVEYNRKPFFTIDCGTGDALDECDSTLVIPVSLHNFEGDATISVSLEGSTAVEGTDFKLVSPADGKLKFSAGKTVQNIEVKIFNQPNVFKGDLYVFLSLSSATEGLQSGAASSYAIKIGETDFQCDWSTFAGNYSAIDHDMKEGTDGDAYDVTIEKVDETTFAMSNLWDGGNTIQGTVDFATKTITIASGQQLYVSSSYGPIAIYFVVGNSYVKSFSYKITASGVTVGSETNPYNAVITSGTYAGYYMQSCYTKLTKK